MLSKKFVEWYTESNSTAFFSWSKAYLQDQLSYLEDGVILNETDNEGFFLKRTRPTTDLEIIKLLRKYDREVTFSKYREKTMREVRAGNDSVYYPEFLTEDEVRSLTSIPFSKVDNGSGETRVDYVV